MVLVMVHTIGLEGKLLVDGSYDNCWLFFKRRECIFLVQAPEIIARKKVSPSGPITFPNKEDEYNKKI